mmetsp:Transcript_11336/g.27662  ORF Transcript_11336/g.27662 Transcript_11336/m.27662 type:complete len:340 (-) Transcript_11336:394-1413(-)|eukprot:CAMPEP_0181357806 /NCGR_PEP_ID=MMETSP1106-20121128/5165_1 /TAXON_ID=81844 /ORGANISM="Mantoniella antarctica, Strain SL-175" /LENGTH=339 /DNA_ID=CAMNT_0023470709 /DNA_START=155 /DNA_END=1174 /DNA_ORIENTATION=+
MAASLPLPGGGIGPGVPSGLAGPKGKSIGNTGSSVSAGASPSAYGQAAKGGASKRTPVRSRAIRATLSVAAGAAATGAFVATASDTPKVKLAGRKKSDPVAFFDLDHTIIDANSNKHWVQREFQNGKVKPKMIVTAMYWFTRYALGFGAGAETAGAEAAMLYSGIEESDLRRQVEAVFDEELAHRMRPGCKPVMDKHMADGLRCVVCTSSWQYAAQHAARLFNCETAPENVISSVMASKDGVVTGAIDVVAYGDGKYHATKAWADLNGVDLKQCYFYTDSMSDVMLMENVGFPVAVNPDARLRARAKERGWAVQDWGVSEVKKTKKKPMFNFEKTAARQ